MPRPPLCITAAALLATACGSSTRLESETHTTTVGQELLDLQRAFDNGVITENDRRAKKNILRRYDR